MNFLAHLYLSGENKMILIGNFLGDFVVGKKLENYPQDIQKGILLHREIDSFTDQNLFFKHMTAMLHQEYGKYAAVIADIFMDHFLAVHFEQYHSMSLKDFAQKTYSTLEEYQVLFPPKAQMTFQAMQQNNWLYHYASQEGIRRSLEGMAYRSQYGEHIRHAIHTLNKEYTTFESLFTAFFPQIQLHLKRFE